MRRFLESDLTWTVLFAALMAINIAYSDPFNCALWGFATGYFLQRWIFWRRLRKFFPEEVEQWRS